MASTSKEHQHPSLRIFLASTLKLDWQWKRSLDHKSTASASKEFNSIDLSLPFLPTLLRLSSVKVFFLCSGCHSVASLLFVFAWKGIHFVDVVKRTSLSLLVFAWISFCMQGFAFPAKERICKRAKMFQRMVYAVQHRWKFWIHF